MMTPIQERMAKYTDEKVIEARRALHARMDYLDKIVMDTQQRVERLESRIGKPIIACGNDDKDASGARYAVPRAWKDHQLYEAQRDNDRLRIENAKQEATINTMAKVIGSMKKELAVAKGDLDYWQARSRRFEKELFNHLVNHPIDTL